MLYKMIYRFHDLNLGQNDMSETIGWSKYFMNQIRYCATVMFLLLIVSGCSVAPKAADNAGADIDKGVSSSDSSVEVDPLQGEDIMNNGAAQELMADLETNTPPHLIYKLLVAEIAGQRGDLETAMANYVDVAKETNDPKVAERATQISVYAKDYEVALESANLWVEIEPDSPDAHRHLASVLLRLARPADAVKHYEKMLDFYKDDEKPGYGFSVIASQLTREPDRELAMGVMDQIIAKYPENPDALFAYAHLAMRQARFEVALNTLDSALEKKPKWSKAVNMRARVLAMQGARNEALAYLSEQVKGPMSEDVEVGLVYARMLTEARQLDPALDEFVRLAELEPRNSEVNYYAGVLALQLEKFDQSRKFLEHVLKLGKRVQETNYYLGQIAENTKDYEGALNRYSFVRHGEYYFNAQLRTVSILAEKKEFQKARSHIQTIRTNGQKEKLQLLLLEGDILREAGRYPAAKDFYSKALQSMPNETSIRYARALIAEKLGELDLVEKDLQTILEKEPTNAQVLNALGYTLADRTTRFDEALGYIEKAFKLEPNDAAVVDSMGWVQYRLGNYSQAIEYLRKATELSQDPEIAAHLGEVLWVSGDKDSALKVWETTLKDHPDDKVLLEVMKKFGIQGI